MSKRMRTRGLTFSGCSATSSVNHNLTRLTKVHVIEVEAPIQSGPLPKEPAPISVFPIPQTPDRGWGRHFYSDLCSAQTSLRSKIVSWLLPLIDWAACVFSFGGRPLFRPPDTCLLDDVASRHGAVNRFLTMAWRRRAQFGALRTWSSRRH
jgi:hypothetical protein